MRSKSYFLFTAALLAAVFFTLAGCSGSSSQNGKGAITAKLVWNGAKTTAKRVASAPVGVVTVQLSISGSGYSGLTQDFAATDGKGTLSGVSVGSGLTVTALGLDSSGAVIYQGSVSGVTVVDGQTTDVGTITMQTPTFTAAMVSGKAFNDDSGGSVAFNADGTFVEKDPGITYNGTWTINSFGGLVLTFTDTTTATMTLVSTTTSTFSVALLTTHADGSTSTGTMTLTQVFTHAMLAGKTFTYNYSYNGGSTGTVTVNADGTATSTRNGVAGTINGTWIINSAGQFVQTITSATNVETDTLTLTSATATTLNGIQTWKNSSDTNTGSGTLVLTEVTGGGSAAPPPAPSYSNASLGGVWLLLDAGGASASNNVYFVGDGAGGISGSGMFNPATPAGSYAVQSNGSYVLNLIGINDGTIPFTGALTSPARGLISWAGGSGTIAKVTDIAACQGTWSGTVTETTAHAISLTVDTTGAITSSTGFTGPVYGNMFCESGNVVAFFTTGATDAFNQVNITATLSGITIAGSVFNDGPSSAAVATVTLTRGLPPLVAKR